MEVEYFVLYDFIIQLSLIDLSEYLYFRFILFVCLLFLLTNLRSKTSTSTANALMYRQFLIDFFWLPSFFFKRKKHPYQIPPLSDPTLMLWCIVLGVVFCRL